MKKSFLAAIALTVLLVSCKKEKKTEFTATDMTGNATIWGKVTKPMISQNQGNGYSTYIVPAAGVRITARVNNNSLYPNSTGSNSQGSRVYETTTDANGNYSLPVLANGNGVTCFWEIHPWQGTVDTIINGVIKTGLVSNFTGASGNTTLIKGVSWNRNHQASTSAILTNPVPTPTVCTAIVTGSLRIQYLRQDTIPAGGGTPSTNYFYVPTSYTLANHPVKLMFDKDPITQATKIYYGTSNSQGIYSFTIETTDWNASGFWNQDASVYVEDYATTMDTVKLNGSKVMGRAGVYHQQWNYSYGIYCNEIRNAVHLNYNSFTAN